MLTQDKVTEIFCIVDEFCKKFEQELPNLQQLSENGKQTRSRSRQMSDSEMITILMLYHFGGFDNFKFYYLHYICIHLKKYFSNTLSYSRFIQIQHRLFIPMMFFLNTVCFGRCTEMTFNDMLKNISDIELTRHRSIYNFIMSLIAALPAMNICVALQIFKYSKAQPLTSTNYFFKKNRNS